MPTVPVPRVALVDGKGVVTGPGWYYLQQLITQQTSIANINEQVAAVLAQFAVVQAQFAAVQTSVSALSASVSALQSSVSAMGAQIVSLQAQMAAANTAISALQSEQDSFLLAETNSTQRVEDYSALLLQ